MSQEVNTSAPDVTDANQFDQYDQHESTQISDEAYEKFFESEGEADPAEVVKKEEPSEGKQGSQQEAKPDENKDKEKDDVNEKITKLDSNYKAMAHQERMLRKEMEEKMRNMETAFNRFQEKLKTPDVEPPSYDENPLEALKFQQQQIAERQKAHEDYLRQQAQAQEFEQRRNQFVNAYRQKASEFASEKQDWNDAYEYMKMSRYQDLVALGYNDDQEILNRMLEDEASMVAKAFQDGVNPAERLYKLAETRGYRANSKQTADSENAKSLEDAKRKIETAQKGVQASRSLSDASARPGNEGPMTLERLGQIATDLDDNEFGKLFDKMIATNKRN